MDKAVESITTCIQLSQEVINAGSKFGGNLSEEERLAVSQPIVRVFV